MTEEGGGKFVDLHQSVPVRVPFRVRRRNCIERNACTRCQFGERFPELHVLDEHVEGEQVTALATAKAVEIL